MTRTLFIATIVATTFAAVGCSQTASLTGPTTALSAAVTPALAASASGDLPFKGRLEGSDEDSDFTSTSLVVTTVGTGNSTLLGAFKFTQVVTLYFSSGTTTGSARFVAANGDEVDTKMTGSGHPTDTPGEFSITDHHTITGGTGRFAGAQGSFEVDRVASGITFLTSGSFGGTISSPGPAH